MKFIILFFLFFSPFIAFSNPKHDLDNDIYQACENSESSNSCQDLLMYKYQNNTYNSFRSINYNKQYHIGITFSSYRIDTLIRGDYSERFGYPHYIENINYNYTSVYFEYLKFKVFYLGARLGLFQDVSYHYYIRGYRDEQNLLGIAFHPYLKFVPFFNLKYFTFGISVGALFFYINENMNEVTTTVDLFVGLKISNFLKITFEAGKGEHLGLTLGLMY